MRIDFVSDIACPWCAVGLNSLERALARIGDDIPIELHFQPFELNPSMPAEGADAVEYLSAKYGIDAAQIARNQAVIRARGAEVGFEFGHRSHVWNTFDAHRVMHWAGAEGPASAPRQLKQALLTAYHGQGLNPSSREVLTSAAQRCGLDAEKAGEVLDSGAYANEVRQAQSRWQSAGIQSVPSVVIDERHLIQGGQPPEVFEQALRRLAAATEAA